MKVRIVTHYGEDDPEFVEDYYSIEVFNEAGERICHAADSYHEDRDYVDGFLEGLAYATGEQVEITSKEEVADGQT